MKTAVVVGINNYADSTSCPPLSGCINDATDMEGFLRNSVGLQDVLTLTDGQASAANIMSALRKGVGSLQNGDEFIFHYSGHGCPFPLDDVVHDAMCPVDFDWSRGNAILDSDLSSALGLLTNGARVTIVADSCNSGGLQPDYRAVLRAAAAPQHKIRTIPVPPDIAAEIARIRKLNHVTSFRDVVQTVSVVLVSACTAQQNAADSTFGTSDRPNGALTYYLLQEMQQPNALTLAANVILNAVDSSVQQAQYAQTPQLHGLISLFSSPPF